MSPDRNDGPGGTAAAPRPDTVSLVEARFRLIEKLMDVNSRQLRCDSALAGADIELARLRRDAAVAGAPPELADQVEAQAQRHAALEGQRQRLVVEREWLDAALAEFDTGEAPAPERVGRA